MDWNKLKAFYEVALNNSIYMTILHLLGEELVDELLGIYLDILYSVSTNLQDKHTCDTIQIKFIDTGYLNFDEAYRELRNYFFSILDKKTILEFVKGVIFTNTDYNFHNISKIEVLGGYVVNYTALVHFMQIDLCNLRVEDLEYVKKDFIEMTIKINPLFDTQQVIKENIRDLFYFNDGIKINNTKNISKYEKLRRIFDIYLITKYPEIYLDAYSGQDITDKDIFMQLRKFGFTFGKSNDTTWDEKNLKLESRYNHTFIEKDILVMNKIRSINLGDMII
jgi:hypothetical protein